MAGGEDFGDGTHFQARHSVMRVPNEHMLYFVKNHSFLKDLQTMLVGSLFGEKILPLIELARWSQR